MKVTHQSVLLATCLTTAPLSMAMDNQVYTCGLNDHTRRVVIHYSHAENPVPCEVKYYKDTEGGGVKVLWQAQSSAGYCEKKAEEFVSKLSGWGWQCELQLTAKSS
jgi:hypothetical protein